MGKRKVPRGSMENQESSRPQSGKTGLTNNGTTLPGNGWLRWTATLRRRHKNVGYCCELHVHQIAIPREGNSREHRGYRGKKCDLSTDPDRGWRRVFRIIGWGRLRVMETFGVTQTEANACDSLEYRARARDYTRGRLG